jgi:hypothetical protein
MAANGTYSRGMLVLRRLIHKLVQRHNLANNNEVREGKNSTISNGNCNLRRSQMRKELGLEPVLNIHRQTHPFPSLSSPVLTCTSLSQQSKKLCIHINNNGGICPLQFKPMSRYEKCYLRQRVYLFGNPLRLCLFVTHINLIIYKNVRNWLCVLNCKQKHLAKEQD